MAHRTKLTPQKKSRFLNVLSKTANVTSAAQCIGLARRSMYDARERDANFAKRWDDAVETAVDHLEKEAWRRAFDGIDEPVFYKGDECGYIRKYSDTLLIFLLKGHRPEKYVERHQIEGGSKPITINVVNYGDKPTI